MVSSRVAFIWMVNTPDRLVGINATLFFINQSKYREMIDVWIAASSAKLEQQIHAILQSSPYSTLHIHTMNVNDTSWYGYKKKLSAIIPAYEYFIKCDDDLFYSEHVLDFFIERRDQLNTSSVVWMFPTSSINSLTTDTFIEDFVEDPIIRGQIYNDFASFNYHSYPSDNGTDNLESLKQFFFTLRGSWNPQALREYMWSRRYFNGGEHPIRHSNPAITKLNTYIINNLSRVFTTIPTVLEPIRGFYQAQFYIMRSDRWCEVQHLVDTQKIPRGLIDECEINWYIKYHEMTALLARNAFVIHPALQGVDLNYYHRMIYDRIQSYLGE